MEKIKKRIANLKVEGKLKVYQMTVLVMTLFLVLSMLLSILVLCVLPLVLFVSFSFPDALIVKVSLVPIQPLLRLIVAFCC